MGMTRASCLGTGMLLFSSTGKAWEIFGLLPVYIIFAGQVGLFSGDLASFSRQGLLVLCAEVCNFLGKL